MVLNDVATQHRALCNVIVYVAFPSLVRPHLSIHALLLEVTIEVVGEQLGRRHRARILWVVGVDVAALVEVLVETRVNKHDLVELKLPCGYSGTRLSIDRSNENTEGPSDNDESEGRNKELQDSEKNSIDFICRHGRNSFGVARITFSCVLHADKACVKALSPNGLRISRRLEGIASIERESIFTPSGRQNRPDPAGRLHALVRRQPHRLLSFGERQCQNIVHLNWKKSSKPIIISSTDMYIHRNE